MSRTRILTTAGVLAALTAVGARLCIPLPMLQVTLQTLFVLLAGLLLPWRAAGLSMLCYVLLGLLGLPVFAGGGGIGYVLQPGFGFVLGFVPGAMLTAVLRARGRTGYGNLVCAGLAGLAVIYALGLLWYWAVSVLYLGGAAEPRRLLLHCLVLPLPFDLIKCALASAAALRLRRAVRY